MKKKSARKKPRATAADRQWMVQKFMPMIYDAYLHAVQGGKRTPLVVIADCDDEMGQRLRLLHESKGRPTENMGTFCVVLEGGDTESLDTLLGDINPTLLSRISENPPEGAFWCVASMGDGSTACGIPKPDDEMIDQWVANTYGEGGGAA